MESWTYTDSSQYGSEEEEKQAGEILRTTLGADGNSVKITLMNFFPSIGVNSMYRILIANAKSLLAPAMCRDELEAYYTVREISL